MPPKGSKGRKTVREPRGVKASLASSSKAEEAVPQVSGLDSISVPALEDDSPALSQKRRRLNRRDSDDQVERLIVSKLSNFTSEAIEGTQSSDGVSIRDYLKGSLREFKNDKKRFNPRFWVTFFQKFPLKRSAAERLEMPEMVYGEISDELLTCLAAAHSENPATRSVEPLERFLEHCGELTKPEVYGLLNGVMEGPMVTRQQSYRCLTAILGYIART